MKLREIGMVRIEVLAALLLVATVALVLWPVKEGTDLASAEANAIANLRILRRAIQQHHQRTGLYPVAAELVELTQGDAPFRMARSEDTLEAAGTLFRIWVPAEFGGATSLAAQRARETAKTQCALIAWPSQAGRNVGRILAWIPDEIWSVDNLNTPFNGITDPPPPTLLAGKIGGRAFGTPIRWAERLAWSRVHL
ncbi:MAG: hypothetical protein EXS14_01005 [Planctomycetes bacterium]|nr:hypothetical protein [Planctomycetota bacterium]